MKKLVSLLLALALLLGMASALAETEGKNVYIVTPYLTSVTTKDMAEYIKGNLEEVGCKVTVIDTGRCNGQSGRHRHHLRRSGILQGTDPGSL